MDYSDTTKGLGKGTLACTRRLKRARSLVDKETSRKKLLPVCLAYEKRGHSLWDYWYLFKDKRPKGVTIGDARIKRVLKKVEKNKNLADQVAKIRLEKQEDDTILCQMEERHG